MGIRVLRLLGNKNKLLFIAFIMISLILMTSPQVISKIYPKVSPEQWVGNYISSTIVEENGRMKELRKKLDITLNNDKLIFQFYEATNKGAYLYNKVGGATIWVDAQYSVSIDRKEAFNRVVHIYCKQSMYSNKVMYMEFILQNDMIKWRYCNGDTPEDIEEKNFYILKKDSIGQQ
jgi:hypothetical protein